jgi:hypothetical protein
MQNLSRGVLVTIPAPQSVAACRSRRGRASINNAMPDLTRRKDPHGPSQLVELRLKAKGKADWYCYLIMDCSKDPPAMQKLAISVIAKVAKPEPAIFDVTVILIDGTTALLRLNEFAAQSLIRQLAAIVGH